MNIIVIIFLTEHPVQFCSLSFSFLFYFNYTHYISYIFLKIRFVSRKLIFVSTAQFILVLKKISTAALKKNNNGRPDCIEFDLIKVSPNEVIQPLTGTIVITCFPLTLTLNISITVKCIYLS